MAARTGDHVVQRCLLFVHIPLQSQVILKRMLQLLQIGHQALALKQVLPAGVEVVLGS